MLAIVGADLDAFSSVNAVTALYRIARSLTSRAGRLRRKEAAHVTADARFARLVESVELSRASSTAPGWRTASGRTTS